MALPKRTISEILLETLSKFQRDGEMCVWCVFFFLTCLVEVKQTEYFKIFSNKRHTTKQETLSRRYAIRLVIEKVALGAPW